MSLFKNRPLALLSAAFLFGALITLLLTRSGVSPLWVIPPLLVVFLVLLVLALRKRVPFFMAAVAVCLAVAAIAEAAYDARRFSAVRKADTATAYAVTATVTDIDSKERDYRLYTVRVRTLDGKNADLYLELRIDPEVYPSALSLGEGISAVVTIAEKADDNGYHYSRGIAGSAVAVSVLEITPKDTGSLSLRLASLRQTLEQRLRTSVGGEEAALLSALFLGNRQGLSLSTALAFRRAGLSHTLALSGLHLSVLAALLLRLFRLFRIKPRLSTPIFLAALVFYTALAGAPLSLLRSAGMLVIARIGVLVRRTPDSVTSLFVAVALIVLLSPGAAADLGLWLSFLATLGLLVANELLPFAEGRRFTVARKLLRLLTVSLFILCFTLLLSVLAFGSFSLIAPISTLIISPLIELLLTLTPLALLFPSANFFTDGVAFLAGVALSFVEWLSSLPLYVSARYPVFLLVLALFSAFVFLLLLLPLKGRTSFAKAFSAAFAVLAVTFISCHVYGHYRDFALCISRYESDYLVIKQNGHVTVIDTDSKKHSISALRSALEKEYVTEIDTLIITAGDEQLPLYLSEFTDRLRVDAVVFLCNGKNDEAVESAALLAEEIDLPYRKEAASFTETNGDLTLRVLSGLYTPHRKKPDLLVHVAFSETRLLYLSSNAPAMFGVDVLASYFPDVDCVIVGSYPETATHRVTSPFPENTLTVTAYSEALLPSKGGRFPQLPEHFLFPLS